MKIQTRLLIFTACFILLTAVVVGGIGFRLGLENFQDSTERIVIQARDQKSEEVKKEFENIGNGLRVLSDLTAARETVQRLAAERQILQQKIQTMKLSPDLPTEIAMHYRTSTSAGALHSIAKMTPISLYLQSEFIKEAREKDITTAEITTFHRQPPFAYFKSLALAHPAFSDFQQRYHLEDLILTDTAGNVLYTVEKNLNFGANLQTGVLSSSPLAHAFRWSLSATPGAYRVFDLAPQSSFQPKNSIWISAPIYNQAHIIGGLIAQISEDRLDEIIALPGPVEVLLLTRHELPPRKGLQASNRLTLPGVEWQLISRLKETNNHPTLNQFFTHSLLILIPIIGLLLGAAAVFCRKLIRPLQQLREELETSTVPQMVYSGKDEFAKLIEKLHVLMQELDTLRKSEHFLKSTFESAQDLVFLVNDEQQIEMTSAYTCEVLGVPPNSLRGGSLNTWVDLGGKELKASQFQQDGLLKTISGKSILVQVSWQAIPNPLAAGKNFYLITGTDISERSQKEKDFKIMDTLFRESQAAFHIGSFIWDIKNDKSIWSDEEYKIFGLDPQKTNASFEKFRSLVLIDDQAPLDRAIATAYKNMGPFKADFRVRKADTQEIIWIRSAARTVFDSYGEPMTMYGAVQDITEMKRAEQSLISAKNEAMKSSQAKSEFLARMSHEIRTPMNAIMGMADLLKETELSEDQQYYVTIFCKAGEVLMALINDILDLSKIEAGEVSLENIPFDLSKLLTDIQEFMKPRALEKGLEYSFDINPQISPYLLGDPTKVRQVLINLIGNSLKFTERGSIRVTIGRNPSKKDHLLISVNDTGLGIPLTKQHLIFQKFSQADSSITRKYGGTGLGLAISKSLVELMGGQIWFKSREGVGTSFFITIPYHEQITHPVTHKPLELKAPELSFIPKKERDPNHKVRILIADDTEDNRILFTRYLDNQPCEIIEAENGLEAIDKIKSEKFDIIFMDVQMPELDGYAATAQIREWEKSHDQAPTPIIALTAHALSEDRTKSIKAGCDDHITKPFKKKTILSVIEKFS
jgi:signal transduction histidine kinase/ActR/RegA family two-component response regulator